jgi:hypothetical protein
MVHRDILNKAFSKHLPITRRPLGCARGDNCAAVVKRGAQNKKVEHDYVSRRVPGCVGGAGKIVA